MDALDFDLHLLAQLLVERAERLVHQQQARRRNQGARHRDALLLAAGELARIAGPRCAELQPGRASRRCAGAASSRESHVRMRSGKPMFSATVMCGNSA